MKLDKNENYAKNLISLLAAAGVYVTGLGAFAQSPPDVNVSVNFDTVNRTTDQYHFGMCTPYGFDPRCMSNARFNAAIDVMGNKFQRLQVEPDIMFSTKPAGWAGYDMHWWTTDNKWDVAKIQAVIRSMPTDRKFLINITYPYFLMPNPSGGLYQRLDPSKAGTFAKLCAQLVQIISPIRKDIYYEVINEMDGPYFDYGSPQNEAAGASALAQVYNDCAVAMKKVDEGTIVGGPALAAWSGVSGTGNIANQLVFIKHALSNLDFFSIHIYPDMNSLHDSNQTIYLKARNISHPLRDIVQAVRSVSPTLPVFIDEYNINGNTNPCESRQLTNVGAVCDAVENIEALRAGVSRVAAHDAYLDQFSHFDGNYQLRPNGLVQRMFNTLFVGNITFPSTSADWQVMALGATNRAGQKSLMIVNQNSKPTTISISFQTPIARGMKVIKQVVDAKGFSATNTNTAALSETIELPPDSVTVFQITNTRG